MKARWRYRKWHPKRLRMRSVQVRLPPLTPEEAVILADVLEELVGAVWKTFGDGMADYLGAVDPEGMPEQDPPDIQEGLQQALVDVEEVDF